MKFTLAFLLTAILAVSQITTTGQNLTGYSIPIQVAPDDTPVLVPTTYDYAIAIDNYIFKQVVIYPALTLTLGINSTATVIPLSSITGISVGMGLCILSLPSSTSPPPSACSLIVNGSGCTPGPACLAITGGEIVRVTSCSASSCTVSRNTGSTGNSGIGTPSSYTTGQFVLPMKWGSYSDYAAAYFSAQPPSPVATIVQNAAYGSPSALLIQSQIASLVASLSVIK